MLRRRQELEKLRSSYPGLLHDEQLTWVIIPDFPLPPGWSRKTTRLLILVPNGYPTTPPDNFYVSPGLRPEDGGGMTGYSEPVQLLGEAWGQFSWHAEQWRPHADIDKGDNLMAFLITVRLRLSEVN